jgi:hypothetical protein
MKITLTSMYVQDPNEIFTFYAETLKFIKSMRACLPLCWV